MYASENRGSFVTNYTTNDGLVQNDVRVVFQDKQGFIWMGTWSGLSRFDGYNFQNYFDEFPEKYGLRSSRFEEILEDSSGYIWVRSYDGDVLRMNPITGNFTIINKLVEPEIPDFRATKMHLTHSGDIWLFSADVGCFRISGSELQYTLYSIKNQQLRSNKVDQNILEDSYGNYWLLTDNGLTLIRPNEEEPKFYLSGSDEPDGQFFTAALQKSDKIYFGTRKGLLWVYSLLNQTFELVDKNFGAPINYLLDGIGHQLIVSTDGNGFFLVEEETFHSKHYHTKNSVLCSNNIVFLSRDSRSNLFIYTRMPYIMRLNLATEKMFSYKGRPSSPPAGAYFAEDLSGNIWTRMTGVYDLFLYDSVSDKMVSFAESPLSAGRSYHTAARSAFFDRQGNLWCRGIRGVDKITFFQNKLGITLFDENTQYANEVRAILEDSHQQLWVSTKDEKLWILDSTGNKKGYLCKNGSVGYGTPLDDVVYSLVETSDGEIWAGTKAHGVYRFIPAGSGYRIQSYQYDEADPYSLSGNSVYALLEDTRGRLWVATTKIGLNLVEKNDGKVRFLNHRNHLDYPVHKITAIRCLAEDPHGRICLGTTSGLIILDFGDNPRQGVKFRHFYQNGLAHSLNNNDIQNICFWGKDMFLATTKGGVNRVTKWDAEGYPLQFKAYTRQDGLSSDITYSVLPDHQGVLWIVSEENLAGLNPKTERLKKYGDIPKIIGNEHFSEGASYCTRSGKLYFGYSQGLLSFRPEQMTSNTYTPSIVLTDFKAFDKKQSADSLSVVPIDFSHPVRLGHTQNSFHIGFAALDFTSHANIRYAYRLEGFDPTWVESKTSKLAYYANLPQGNYTFRVRSTNSDGVWIENELLLPIRILPSFWQSNIGIALAIFLSLLLAIAAAALLLYIYRIRTQSQLSEMKARFFTDISHEIRTPLTLIAGPVEHLIHDPDTPVSVKEQLKLVSRNSDRMARMVNQVLDLRKAEHSRLRVEEIVPGRLMEDVASHFQVQAESAQIDFVVDDQTNGATVWANRDELEKIVFNLLSNAFKHTSHGKKIRLLLQRTNSHTLIIVEDEGEGIPQKHLNHIFERFFTVDKTDTNANSGIGLSLVQELVKKCGGKIAVESELGLGSQFTIFLQNGYEHYGANVDFIVPKNLPAEILTSDAGADHANLKPTPDKHQSILVVEDDPDLRRFLQRILASQYHVIEAVDGKDGFAKAMKHIPDFIVSDVMMPEMDGTQLLQRLKTTLNTSHIPVILLTAKGSMENKLKGLEYGADDYIVKPFSIPYLKARIENLLRQREQLQQLYRAGGLNQAAKHDTEGIRMSKHDQQFLESVERDVEKHLSESDYSIDKLAETLDISRSALFKKVKSLTGMAPVELLRDIRLRNAAKLLTTTQQRIKEVSYQVGISDVKYFTQCFKKKYGVTPGQYRGDIIH